MLQDAHTFLLTLMNTIYDDEWEQVMKIDTHIESIRSMWYVGIATSNVARHSAVLSRSTINALPSRGSAAIVRSKVPLGIPHLNIWSGNPMMGYTISSIHCMQSRGGCGYATPWQTESFLTLPLTPPSHAGGAAHPWSAGPFASLSMGVPDALPFGPSLHSCLQGYFQSESIHGYRCERCGRKTEVQRRKQMARPPPVLCIHVQRKTVDMMTGAYVKVSTPLAFPLQLDMQPFSQATATRRSGPVARFSAPVSSRLTADSAIGNLSAARGRREGTHMPTWGGGVAGCGAPAATQHAPVSAPAAAIAGAWPAAPPPPSSTAPASPAAAASRTRSSSGPWADLLLPSAVATRLAAADSISHGGLRTPPPAQRPSALTPGDTPLSCPASLQRFITPRAAPAFTPSNSQWMQEPPRTAAHTPVQPSTDHGHHADTGASRWSNWRYVLAAVVEHRGSAVGGHYVTYRRLPQRRDGRGQDFAEQEWVLCSDEYVRPVSTAEVLRAQCYMLFYVREDEHQRGPPTGEDGQFWYPPLP